MTYNIEYSAFMIRQSILNIDDEDLDVIIKAYLNGDTGFTIAGVKYWWSYEISSFKIFNNPQNKTENEIIEIAKKYNSFFYDNFSRYVGTNILEFLGQNVTKEKISNKSFGSEKNNKIYKEDRLIPNYISLSRINELKSLKTPFDLSKLIRMCEELNSNFEKSNYYSVAMIGRAIIDHIPPLFNCKNFNEVANNYGSKSIRGNLKHLNDSMRNISDGALHSHIRKSEPLPTSSQVNFSQDLDVLLGEIVAYYK
ncbi:hypothetical protein [Flavobacterium capsici]|uniref:Uncharacterized protein n=1 Tax=Flavobacterium capsici TaxID=3075618 RepID=A0AA96JBH9_9FLAO|nr:MULTISPECIES: hypothetical protein [unclassified Flavobacterium]WNM18598.1 hypothetical protein RN608_11330 [Flavobacterium sp. PMR2A8]WNM22649.1 hypothetical protein RN605_04630 [Flavobacterium sp. PMTSA4]